MRAQIIIRDILDLSNQLRLTLSRPVHFLGLVFHLDEWGQSLFQVQNAIFSPVPAETLQLLETTSLSLLWFLVILVSVHLFLSEWPTIRNRIINLAPPSYHPDMEELYNRIRRVWMAYLRGQIVLMIIVGVVFTIAWIIIGIPGALVLGCTGRQSLRLFQMSGRFWQWSLQPEWRCWKGQPGFPYQISGWQALS